MFIQQFPFWARPYSLKNYVLEDFYIFYCNLANFTILSTFQLAALYCTV